MKGNSINSENSWTSKKDWNCWKISNSKNRMDSSKMWKEEFTLSGFTTLEKSSSVWCSSLNLLSVQIIIHNNLTFRLLPVGPGFSPSLESLTVTHVRGRDWLTGTEDVRWYIEIGLDSFPAFSHVFLHSFPDLIWDLLFPHKLYPWERQTRKQENALILFLFWICFFKQCCVKLKSV